MIKSNSKGDQQIIRYRIGSGKFITIEGSEGVGKSTNIAFISNYLKSKDITTIETREPGGTKTAEEIRRVLLNTEGENCSRDRRVTPMFFAARSFHVENLIKPAINQGHLCNL